MTPYEDADLAALLLGRGLLDEERLRRAGRLCSSAAPRSGALARALVETGALDRTTVDAALADLLRFVVACAGCGRRFCALPALAPRRVACPGCGRPRDVAARAPEVPPTVAPRRRAPSDQAAVIPPTRRPPASTRAGPRAPTSDAGRAATMAMPGSERPPREGTLPLPGSDAGRGVARGGDGGLLPGARVGPYEVEREVSRGAMGVVLRARHVEVAERVVAIKVMAADLEQDPDGLRRFQREGEVLASLDHPSVVRVYDAGRLPDGRPYLTMDFVEGTTLEHLARQKPVPVAEAARLLEVVARGVAYMNARGVVHRDLKLGNVLLDAAGAPRIADFGLAHVAGGVTRITQQGDLLGTPLYMAPEVVRGEEGVDGRIDVYALGVMLFRLITGSYPFYATTSVALFDLVLHAPVTYPADLGPDARAVLERALARDRGLRYPDAAALADDLGALARGAPVSARPIGRLERLGRALGPGRVALVAAALAAGVLAGGGVWLVRRWPEWRAEREAAGLREGLARQRALLLQGDGDEAAGERAAVREVVARLRASLDVASAAGGDEGWGATIEVLRAAAGRGDEAAAGALAGLEEEVERLSRLLERLEVATAARALGRDPATFDPARLIALRARVTAAEATGDEGPATFDDAAARVHLACGRLDAARAALARAGAGADPTLAAWVHARAGDLDRALDAPVDLAARADLALAAAAIELTGARLARARVARAALPEGPEAALADARLAWLDDVARDDPARLTAHLAAARAAVPPGAAPGARARAALHEADVLLALGWWASAAHALDRARDLLGPAPSPALPLEVAPGRAVVGPRQWALLQRARARARLLDPAAALAAADEAVAQAQAEGPAEVLAAALALRAEALELAGRSAAAAEALAQARAAGGAPEEVAAAAARLACWRDGIVDGPLPGADAAAAAAALAAAEAELRGGSPSSTGRPRPSSRSRPRASTARGAGSCARPRSRRSRRTGRRPGRGWPAPACSPATGRAPRSPPSARRAPTRGCGRRRRRGRSSARRANRTRRRPTSRAGSRRWRSSRGGGSSAARGCCSRRARRRGPCAPLRSTRRPSWTAGRRSSSRCASRRPCASGCCWPPCASRATAPARPRSRRASRRSRRRSPPTCRRRGSPGRRRRRECWRCRRRSWRPCAPCSRAIRPT
ncbi:MAG: protein kinase [Planctomycetes bacterium]|nr:protein kinase [Planctomycetota bacterium]